MYSNWNYQNLPGKSCRIEKNPIIISPYSIFEVNKLLHDKKNLILNINQIFNIICPSIAKTHSITFSNNHKVINKNKMSCNTLCPCISSVWEQYSKILHNMHFDHVIWHHNAFCNLYEKCNSVSVVTLLG